MKQQEIFYNKEMEKISAVIITFNEEKNIKKCINSLKDIADEIIVLDSFSTDKTEEICIEEKVRFYKHIFDGHIQQKNRVIEYATHKYVLSLDADEVISEELKKSILEIKESIEFDSYYFNRLNYYCGKPIRTTNWYPDKKLRIWNKEKGKWGGENPHDKVIMHENSSLKYIQGNLLHYSFNSIEEHLNQSNKFSKIAAEQLILKNKKNLFFKMIFSPTFKFVKNYVLKFGILGGFNGFLISALIAHETFLKYAKAIHKKRSMSENIV
jgi:glycosyltransferase involved in cell wall biosynthesis